MVKKNLEIYMGAYIQDYGLQQQVGRRDHRFHQEEQMQSAAVAHLPCFLNLCSSFLVVEGIFQSCLCSSF